MQQSGRAHHASPTRRFLVRVGQLGQTDSATERQRAAQKEKCWWSNELDPFRKDDATSVSVCLLSATPTAPSFTSTRRTTDCWKKPALRPTPATSNSPGAGGMDPITRPSSHALRRDDVNSGALRATAVRWGDVPTKKPPAPRRCWRQATGVVEVAGIEPASSNGDSGLLRAQLSKRSTRPRHSSQQVADRPSSSKCPRSP